LGHCCGISPDVTGIAVRKVQHEEVRLLLNTADPDQGFTEVGLSVARRMRQRHEHLLATSFPLPDVVFDDRIAAGEAAFIAKPVKHPLRRMPLLARHGPVRLQPPLDNRNERIELWAPDLGCAPIARRNRKRHHLPNRVPRHVEYTRRFPLAHTLSTSLTNSQIKLHAVNPRALPAAAERENWTT